MDDFLNSKDSHTEKILEEEFDGDDGDGDGRSPAPAANLDMKREVWVSTVHESLEKNGKKGDLWHK